MPQAPQYLRTCRVQTKKNGKKIAEERRSSRKVVAIGEYFSGRRLQCCSDWHTDAPNTKSIRPSRFKCDADAVTMIFAKTANLS